MALLDVRRHTGYLFVAVLVGHVILISAQVNTQRGVPLLEALTFGVFAEVQRATAGAVGGVRGAWDRYVALRDLERDNEALRSEVDRLQVQIQEDRALARQAQTFSRLLDLRERTSLNTAAAVVIGGSASPDFRTVTIDKGRDDGLADDMAVIAPSGVVGRVILPVGRAAKVQLLIDRNAAAGAMIERSRVQGVAVGTGGDRMRLDYVPANADIRTGDLVVTSGIDGIYPKGFIVGQIESVERGQDDFSLISIRPAVDFASLEAVLVVLDPPPAAAGGGEGE